MNELDNALFCDLSNRQNYVDKRKKEMDLAYSILKNMVNMLREHQIENRELPIPWHKKPSDKIRYRYGIDYESDFNDVWVVLERLCNGEYILKEK